MNILFICHRIPYPPNKGEKIRSYNILKHLGRHHNVHLAFLVDDRQDMASIESLRPMVKSLHYDIIQPKLKKLRSGLALLGSKPISVPYFYSSALQRKIDAILDKEDIDAILCYSSPTAEYIFRSKMLQDGRGRTASLGRGEKPNNNAKPETTSKTQSSVLSTQHSGLRSQSSGSPHPSIPASQRPSLSMDFIDLDSYKWRQYAENSRFPMQWVYHREAKYLQQYEIKIAKEFDHSFFTSEDEKKLFLSQSPDADITAMGNGVDTDYFNPNFNASKLSAPLASGSLSQHSALSTQHADSVSSPQSSCSFTLVFTGMMDYLPNVEGITWFADRILPAVQNRFPGTVLYIVGNRPTPAVKRLAQRKGIIVTGFVEDVRDHLSIADICVAPLRIARGVQNKVLEAMAMGKPTVCTPEALGGIDAAPGKDIAVASDENDFSEKIIDLLTDPPKADSLGNHARRFVEKNASWSAQLEVLDKILAK